MIRYIVALLFAVTLVFTQGKGELLPDSCLIPGQSYFSTGGYSEYVHGNLPIVLTAPHGGYDKPEEINDRTRSALNQDIRTMELTRELSKRIYEVTGKYPYVIINKLHRIKLDPNREKEVAIQGDSLAGLAYDEFHELIEIAEKDVYANWGTGFYIDIHAHPYKDRRIELGYLLEAELLFFSDEELNDDLFVEKSSLKNLAKISEYSFAELLRGEVSIGALLENKGWPVLPSPKKPKPKDQFFFSGGYNTVVHGTKSEYNFNGMQIETYWDGLRDTDENIRKFCVDYTDVIIEFMKRHYKIDLTNLSE
ncbi:MAG: hypothetical protein KKA84_15510 [Bacteroidetes bacterium]|nr:hypothetical protein [Bacteroidota bacterium]